MLIAMECHARGITPTYVAGFRASLDLNRCVRKGEKAIRILVRAPGDSSRPPRRGAWPSRHRGAGRRARRCWCLDAIVRLHVLGRVAAQSANRPMRQSTGEHCRQSQPSCGRTTDSSDLAVLLRWRRNERQAGAELVDDLLDGGRSFDGHGRAGTQHPRRTRRCRRNGPTPSSSTQRRAASARRARGR